MRFFNDESLPPRGGAKMILACLVVMAAARAADAHSGRRFSIEVHDGQLVAQGMNTGSPDGAPDVRPYTNVIHDHWRNVDLIGSSMAKAATPEFDILNPDPRLQSYPLAFSLLGVSKWAAPPLMPSATTTPVFQSLDPFELVRLRLSSQTTDSRSLGSIDLTPWVPRDGAYDIGIEFSVNRLPANEIYVVEFMLSTTAPEIRSSDVAYLLLSPDGATATERLHHASLYLESYLGSRQVPEPASGALLAFVTANVFCSRRRPRAGALTGAKPRS